MKSKLYSPPCILSKTAPVRGTGRGLRWKGRALIKLWMDESEPSIAMRHDGIGTCIAARLKTTCLRQTWRHKKSARIGREPLTGMCNKHNGFSSDPTSLLRGRSRGHAKEITPLLHCTINRCCTGWGISRGETIQVTPRSLISGVYFITTDYSP